MIYTRLHDRALEADLAIILTDRRKNLQRELGVGYNGHEFSQRALADQIGISSVGVCHWETGVHYPGSWAQWARWARAVRCTFIMPRIDT